MGSAGVTAAAAAEPRPWTVCVWVLSGHVTVNAGMKHAMGGAERLHWQRRLLQADSNLWSLPPRESLGIGAVAAARLNLRLDPRGRPCVSVSMSAQGARGVFLKEHQMSSLWPLVCASVRNTGGGRRAQTPPDEPMRPPIKPQSKFNGVSYFFQNAKANIYYCH